MSGSDDSPVGGGFTRSEILKRGAVSAAAVGVGGALLARGAGAAVVDQSVWNIEQKSYGTIKFFELAHQPFSLANSAKAFEKAFPGSKVQVTVGSFATAHDKMIAQMQAGQFTFDVAYTWAGWLAEMSRFATPLTELGFDVRKSGIYKDMLPCGIESCSLGDVGKEVFYGLPRGSMPVLLHYNKELLAAKGVKVPKTWAELEAAAKELTGDGIYGYGQGLAQGYLLPPYQVVLHAHGGRQHDARGNLTLNTPQAIDALDAMTRMYQSGWMPPASLGWAFNIDTTNLFKEGKIAMTLDYAMLAFQANQKGSKVVGKTGVALVPARPPVKTGSATEAIGEAWLIPKGSTNPEGALAFLKFLSNPTGLQRDMLNWRKFPNGIYDFTPAYASVYRRPEVVRDPVTGPVAKAALTHQAQGARIPIRAGKHIYSRYNRPYYQQIQTAIEAQLALALRKEKTAKEALRDATSASKSIIAAEHKAYPRYVYRSKYGSG